MAIFEGIVAGLGMMFFLGPVFFTLLQISLQYGKLAGWLTALGIFISDVVCVCICFVGAKRIFEDLDNQFWIGIVGGVILILLGGNFIVNPKKSIASKVQLQSKDYFTFFTKGFVVNFVNPFVFVVWIGVVGFGQGKYNSVDLFAFLVATLLVILVTDSLKVLLAVKLKVLLTEITLVKMYRIIGFVLVLFGMRMIWYSYTIVA